MVRGLTYEKSCRDLILGLLVALAFLVLLGLGAIPWASQSLFGTGCDPVLDPTQCTPSELAAWREAANTRLNDAFRPLQTSRATEPLEASDRRMAVDYGIL